MPASSVRLERITTGFSDVLCPPLSQELVARHVGQAEIEDDEVGQALAQPLARLAAVRRFDDLEALCAERGAQELADRRLVIDHQDAHGGRAHAAASIGLAAARACVIVNTAPERSVRLPAVMVPPIASTKPRQTPGPALCRR